jgi:hypothetical protein
MRPGARHARHVRPAVARHAPGRPAGPSAVLCAIVHVLPPTYVCVILMLGKPTVSEQSEVQEQLSVIAPVICVLV